MPNETFLFNLSGDDRMQVRNVSNLRHFLYILYKNVYY